MTRTALRICPLCEATCGLTLTIDDALGRVTGARGDRDDVFSAGFICPKGASFAELDGDPDRLARPLVRRDGELTEVSWDEAFAAAADGLGRVLREHGGTSVAVYLGNPNAHTIAGALYAPLIIRGLGTRQVYSASTLDQMPKHVALGYLFGNPLAFTVPDLDRTDHLVIIGANPLVSNGSLATAADFGGKLKALRKRGGRLTVIDPNRTRTAELADRHLAPRPGTDAALLFAVVNVLFDEGLVDPGARRSGRTRQRSRRGPRAGDRLPARGRRRALRRGRRRDPHRGARDRRRPIRRRVRPNRHVHSRIRHPGQLAGRRHQHPDRKPRPSRRSHVPALADGVGPAPAEARPRLPHRSLAQPGLRVPRGPVRTARRRLARRDRHPR